MKTAKRNLAFVTFALLVTLTSTSFAAAYETITRRTNLRIQSSETVSFLLEERKYVKNIIVQAEGLRQDSIVEVMVNGNLKGTIYAPGADPSYLVTIEENTESIEFRHRYGSTMLVSSITATVMDSKPSLPQPPHHGENPAGIAYALGQQVIDIVNMLSPYATLEDNEAQLLPIKIAAGQLKVMVEAHGFYAQQTAAALDKLALRLEQSDAYLLRLMESEAMFDTAVELLSIKEQIKDLRH